MSQENVEQLLALLQASFEDGCMVDEEKQGMAQALETASLSPEQVRRLRNRAFDLVRERLYLEVSQAPVLVKWLEGVVKVLDGGGAVVHAESSQVYFSPGQTCLKVIQQYLRSAKRRVDICVFTLSDDRIAEEVLAAHRRGVALRVITDNEKEHDLGSDIGRLRDEGVPVAVDRSEAHMHHKFAIFDGVSLLNGSYNWTRSAGVANEENLVVSRDSALIREFASRFDSMWLSLFDDAIGKKVARL